MVEGAWRGAEAYHFFMIVQRQVFPPDMMFLSQPLDVMTLQLHTGQYTAALKTAVRLCDYDDILDPVDVYSIFALAAIANKSYGMCSKVRLMPYCAFYSQLCRFNVQCD